MQIRFAHDQTPPVGEPAMHFAGIDLFIAFLLAQFGEDPPVALPPHADDGDEPGVAQTEGMPD